MKGLVKYQNDRITLRKTKVGVLKSVGEVKYSEEMNTPRHA